MLAHNSISLLFKDTRELVSVSYSYIIGNIFIVTDYYNKDKIDFNNIVFIEEGDYEISNLQILRKIKLHS